MGKPKRLKNIIKQARHNKFCKEQEEKNTIPNCPNCPNSLDIKKVAGISFRFCEVCGYEGERI